MKLISLNSKAKKTLSGGVKTLQKENFLKRLCEKDASLWKNDAKNKKIISNALGWVYSAEEMICKADEINSFVNSVKTKFTDCVVLGMGGSSIAPEVFKNVFKAKKGYPKLHILDTTHSKWITDTENKVNLKKTLFIFASKSGATVEPHSQFAYFYDKLKKITKTPQKNFIAITDTGTPLEDLAKRLKFRKVFINLSDIGGRFSALTYFGLVPAAISGVNIKKLLSVALDFSDKYLKTYKNNPALMLGCALAKSSLAGKDKMTLLTPDKFSSFGLWVEQLIAESTGKEGKGIVPIVEEPFLKEYKYPKDRVFVSINLRGKKDARISQLKKQGHSFIELYMKDAYDLGAQFFLWELATAAAGAVLEINPFSQPDVEQSKVFMNGILENLDKRKVKKTSKEIEITFSKAAFKKLGNKNLFGRGLAVILNKLISKGDYVGLLPYLNSDKKTHNLLKKIREKITRSNNAATLFGYGPRYLHSTGQLHKGGKNNGIFIILAEKGGRDIAIKGKKYTFNGLISAQSLGDFKALESKGRRVIKLDIPSPACNPLAELLNFL